MADNAMKTLLSPVFANNPISVQILGICSALAVTTKMDTALVMSMAVIAVTAFSNLSVSLIRRWIPPQVRIIIQLVVIASLVIVTDQILKAFVFDISRQLSVFVGLIITTASSWDAPRLTRCRTARSPVSSTESVTESDTPGAAYCRVLPGTPGAGRLWPQVLLPSEGGCAERFDGAVARGILHYRSAGLGAQDLEARTARKTDDGTLPQHTVQVGLC